MALKDLLTAEGRKKFRLERLTKTLLERYAQSEARMEAAEKLKSIGTPQAIHSLARRFSATSENLGIDQESRFRLEDARRRGAATPAEVTQRASHSAATTLGSGSPIT